MRTVRIRGPRGLHLVAEVPTTRRERTRGLRGRDTLAPGRAMFLRRCRSVHTFGMRIPITVACLDRWLGVRWVAVVPPRRVVLPRRGIRHVLELGSDVDVRPGDRLRFDEASASMRSRDRGHAIHIGPR
ncbi:MAG TPA: DUF192 domain-containing protein [Actinomycetota bacterium]